MNEYDFIIYLKSNYPYLYDIETKLKEVREATGFGEVSVSLTMRFKKVEISSIGGFVNKKYVQTSNLDGVSRERVKV